MKLKNIIIKDILLGIAGAISGFLSGMLGAGGGMVALFSLALLCPEEEARDRFAATICAVLPMTVVSACFYLLRGGLLFSEAVPTFSPARLVGYSEGLRSANCQWCGLEGPWLRFCSSRGLRWCSAYELCV